MFKSTVPCKFMGVEERSGEKNGKPWNMKEAVVFIPDVGRVKIPVFEKTAPVHLPELNQQGSLTLAENIGKFGSLVLVWDHTSVFTPIATPVKSAVNA